MRRCCGPGGRGLDPAQASYDGLSRDRARRRAVRFGLPADGAHLHEESATTAAIASFHERLWRLGQTTVAFTCMEQVAAGCPLPGYRCYGCGPPTSPSAAALQVATLLASQQLLAGSQLAVAVVEVPALRPSARRPAPRHASRRLQLTVHRFLVREAQRIQAHGEPSWASTRS